MLMQHDVLQITIEHLVAGVPMPHVHAHRCVHCRAPFARFIAVDCAVKFLVRVEFFNSATICVTTRRIQVSRGPDIII